MRERLGHPLSLPALHAPIAVFDAGIGSYAIARRLHEQYPRQDIIYFADRASFPYGSKSPAELSAIVRDTVARLQTMGAVAVVMASNAPTIMVLDELRHTLPVPVIGVYPPIRAALAGSRSGQVAVLGVASLVTSERYRTYAARETAAVPGASVPLAVNASALVDLVESGAFLRDQTGTQAKVADFLGSLLAQHPGLDTFTLSSTHLPWLREFFERAGPGLNFLDPADAVVLEAGSLCTDGSGAMACLVTESEALPLEDFQAMLDRLRIPLTAILSPV